MQNSFLQSKIPQISSDGDYLQNQNPRFILELNSKNKWFKKDFAHDFSKRNMVLCVYFFLNFLVYEMGTKKKHENNLSKIAET